MLVDNSYYESEVREGFYVPSMMKRCWAAQIEVLEVVSKICRKYGIHYFADSGTLLGAIRHKGFIPWDDDIDIAMKRTDYERFLSVAESELPEGFAVHTIRNDYKRESYCARVVNSDGGMLDGYRIKDFHGFLYGAGIDIFALDIIPRDKEQETLRDTIVDYISGTIFAYDSGKDANNDNLKKIEELCATSFDYGGDIKYQLRVLSERLISLFSEEDGEELCEYLQWKKSDCQKFYYDKSWYDEGILVPFENIEIMVPKNYHEVLKRQFGNYMEIVKAGSLHNYPCYSSCEKELSERNINLKYLYKYPGIGEAERKVANSINYKVIIKQKMRELQLIDSRFRKDISTASSEELLNCLINLQNEALYLGEFIEKYRDSGHISIRALENYCEKIYGAYVALSMGNDFSNQVLEMEKALQNVDSIVENSILQHKEIVFLSYRYKNWDALRNEWENEIKDKNADVYVIPLAYFDKSFDGQPIYSHFDIEQYDKELNAMYYKNYDFATRRPDRVYIDFPYDEYHSAISIDPAFYSSNIVKYTDELIYVPCFKEDDFMADDVCSVANMREYVSTPVMVNADIIKVQSSTMRDRYIEHLTGWAGDSTRAIWEEKIRVID